MTDTLRGVLDKAADLIERHERRANADYRAGWVDALRALRDDPAFATLDRDRERLAALEGAAQAVVAWVDDEELHTRPQAFGSLRARISALRAALKGATS